MKLEKIKKTFNDYKLELSWGQLEAVAAALEQNHADPVADEIYAEWKWYMEHVPGPGEDEDKYEAQQKAAVTGDVAGEGEDMEVPMPPGSETGAADEGGEAPFPPEEAAAEGAGVEGEEPTEAAMRLGAPRDEPGLPEPEMEETEPAPPEETDRRLPKPPRE
jgi:hypothetical protein